MFSEKVVLKWYSGVCHCVVYEINDSYSNIWFPYWITGSVVRRIEKLVARSRASGQTKMQYYILTQSLNLASIPTLSFIIRALNTGFNRPETDKAWARHLVYDNAMRPHENCTLLKVQLFKPSCRLRRKRQVAVLLLRRSPFLACIKDKFITFTFLKTFTLIGLLSFLWLRDWWLIKSSFSFNLSVLYKISIIFDQKIICEDSL